MDSFDLREQAAKLRLYLQDDIRSLLSDEWRIADKLQGVAQALFGVQQYLLAAQIASSPASDSHRSALASLVLPPPGQEKP
jgi:hypothetical protein